MKGLFIHKSILARGPLHNLFWLEPQLDLFLSTLNTITTMTHIPKQVKFQY